jgi:hypothetical protein
MAKRKRGSGGMYVSLMRKLLIKNSVPKGKAERIFNSFVREKQLDLGAFLSWIKEAERGNIENCDIVDIRWALNALIRSRILAEPSSLRKNQDTFLVCRKAEVDHGSLQHNHEPGYINVLDKYIRDNLYSTSDERRIGFMSEIDAQAFANALRRNGLDVDKIKIFKISKGNQEGTPMEIRYTDNLLGKEWTLGTRNEISRGNRLMREAPGEDRFPTLEALRCGSN